MTPNRIPIVVFLFISTLIASAQRHPPAQEQVVFEEGGPFVTSVDLPKTVIQLLLRTEAGKQGQAFVSQEESSDPSKLFRASPARLGRTGDDLIVVGVCPMCGADQGWFWLVRSAHRDPKVVLFAGGNVLHLLESRTNGLRNVVVTFGTASDTYTTLLKFDGEEYKKSRETSTPYTGQPYSVLRVFAAVAPDWPSSEKIEGTHEVDIAVSTDGYQGNVVDAQVLGDRDAFSTEALAAARLWKFEPGKANNPQRLLFVFKAVAKNAVGHFAPTIYFPPYKVLVQRPTE